MSLNSIGQEVIKELCITSVSANTEAIPTGPQAASKAAALLGQPTAPSAPPTHMSTFCSCSFQSYSLAFPME